MDFGQALQGLKSGSRLKRMGWNGMGMFIYLVKGTEITAGDLRNEAAEQVGNLMHWEDSKVKISSHIDMKAADGSITVGWAPSQIDMLAEDWEMFMV